MPTSNFNYIAADEIYSYHTWKHTYYLPKKKKQSSQTLVRENVSRINNIRKYTLLHIESDFHLGTRFNIYLGYWKPIHKLTDFPHKTPKEILTIYTLLQG